MSPFSNYLICTGPWFANTGVVHGSDSVEGFAGISEESAVEESTESPNADPVELPQNVAEVEALEKAKEEAKLAAAKFQMEPEEDRVVRQDLESLDPEVREAKIAADAEALEKAKEEVKSAAAKFQMDPEEEKIVSQDLDSLAPEVREAKLAAEAEALERAKEEVKLASAQFQMETDEADRIMSEKRAKAQSTGK